MARVRQIVSDDMQQFLTWSNPDELRRLQNAVNRANSSRRVKTRNESIKTKNGTFDYKVVDKMPRGWNVIKGATTAPNGYTWVSNGKSRFGGEYQNSLIKTSAITTYRGASKG